MARVLFCILFLYSTTAISEGNALFQFITLKTSEGDIRLRLFKKEAPSTIDNFVGLITGLKPFRDVRNGRKMKDTPFYRDMIFHKVHPDLGIQTGCPWGNGKGWPGYTLKQEKNDLKFDRPYLVAMSIIQGNSNSVGSQFFITTKEAKHLDEDYTVIGEVDSGFEIVKKISLSKRDALMRPIEPIKLNEVVVDP